MAELSPTRKHFLKPTFAETDRDHCGSGENAIPVESGVSDPNK